MAKKDIIYNGLGFPVFLKNVEVIKFRDEELPQINHNELNTKVFELLLGSRFRLTGNQITFIRGYMNLSQAEFAKRLGFESHSTISGWAKKGDEATGMNTPTELAIRMLMASYLNKFDIVNENALSILSEIENAHPEIFVAA